MDQGLITHFNANFQTHFMRKLVSEIDDVQNASRALKVLTIRDSLLGISRLWKDLPTESISKCFSRSYFIFPDTIENFTALNEGNYN